jgi:hypothetical protein
MGLKYSLVKGISRSNPASGVDKVNVFVVHTGDHAGDLGIEVRCDTPGPCVAPHRQDEDGLGLVDLAQVVQESDIRLKG